MSILTGYKLKGKMEQSLKTWGLEKFLVGNVR